MKLSIPLGHAWTIIIASLIINLIFLSATNKRYFFCGLVTEHGEVGYNLCNYNSIKVNPLRIKAISKQQAEKQQLIDYADVNHTSFSEPAHFRSVNDTIGYGVLLGLIWKITNSLRYYDVQILQIILFTLALLLLYKISLLLFGNKTIALWSCLAQLLFFPLIFLNVHPLRDIWAYYGIILLLYGLLRASKNRPISFAIFMCALGFAFCQWIRPPIVFTLFLVAIPIFVWRKESRKAWLTFFIANLFLFWAPFMIYNKIAYDRFFVSTAGQDLFEGLGEFPNSWNIKMDDVWCATSIKNKYGFSEGTSLYQDQAFKLFKQSVSEKPLEYCHQLLRRLPSLFLFAANWSYCDDDLHYAQAIPFFGLLSKFVLQIIEYLMARFQYVRLYLSLGWLTLLILWYRKKYFETLLFFLIACSSASKFFSHLEPRYLVSFYALFSLLIGYGIHYLFVELQSKIFFNKTFSTSQPATIDEGFNG